MILDTKEKYGSFRCYTSFGNEKIFELENKLEMISEWTCIRCGKQPKNSKGHHIIWRTTGWICPYCKDCFRKKISGNDWTKKKERKWQKDLLQQCKEIKIETLLCGIMLIILRQEFLMEIYGIFSDIIKESGL